MNARIVVDEALKSGAVAMNRAGAHARQRLELGFSFARSELGEKSVLFEVLDFADLYRLGNTLLETQKRKLKRALGGSVFENDDKEYFLGMWWTQFLEQSMSEPVKLKIDGSTAAQEICDMKTWRSWVASSETFMAALPFIKKFYLVLEKLRRDGDLQNAFYLNYELSSVDFEAIMLASLINFANGHFDQPSHAKMGVTLQELKEFYHRYFQKRDKEWLLKGDEDPQLSPLLDKFTQQFGLASVPGFTGWLRQVMLEQMNGYEIDVMSEEDFRHVGGPLILIKQN